MPPAPAAGILPAMAFAIVTEHTFAAAHQIVLYDGSLEPIHGHNWLVRVTVERDGLDAIGVVMDFHALHAQVEAILAPFRNRHFNEVPPFDRLSPTAEHIARHVAASLALPTDVRLRRVELLESPGCWAIYEP
jgi:6-pyruvoyltetrahydropterin/6-carboxytetrahydropterin synthase